MTGINLPNGNTATLDGRCKYCGNSRTRIRIGRMNIGVFNKPGLLAYICETCDMVNRDHGTEADVQEP